jgi:hypothetical protein
MGEALVLILPNNKYYKTKLYSTTGDGIDDVHVAV